MVSLVDQHHDHFQADGSMIVDFPIIPADHSATIPLTLRAACPYAGMRLCRDIISPHLLPHVS